MYLQGGAFAYPTPRGDIAELDMLAWPDKLSALPCAREIGAALERIEGGERAAPLRIRHLPRPRPVRVAVEEFDLPSGGVFVRLARSEPVAFDYDILGDGSELIEYTYDGRVLGLRLKAPHVGSGILLPAASLFRHSEVRTELSKLGFRLNDYRPFLDNIDLDGSASRPSHRHPHNRGTAVVDTTELSAHDWQEFAELARKGYFEHTDLHGDGRVDMMRTTSGRLARIRFYQIAGGVDLSGIPEREDIEPIFRHHGVSIIG